MKKCKKEYIGMEYKMIKKEINEIKSQYTLGKIYLNKKQYHEAERWYFYGF